MKPTKIFTVYGEKRSSFEITILARDREEVAEVMNDADLDDWYVEEEDWNFEIYNDGDFEFSHHDDIENNIDYFINDGKRLKDIFLFEEEYSKEVDEEVDEEYVLPGKYDRPLFVLDEDN